MGQLFSNIEPMIVLLLLVIAVSVVQRKFGWRGLLVVWLASTVILVSYYVIQFYYRFGFEPFRTRQILFLLANLTITFSFFSGAVMWVVTMLVPPPMHTASTEVQYFRSLVPPGKLEDTYGLAGILGRYQALLEVHARALDAVPINPYPSLPRALLQAIRTFRPSYVRQARQWLGQRGQVPNILAIDLIGAEDVLVELEKLTTAQLSAIEACHQVNVRRLRQRTLIRLVPGVIGGLTALGGIVKEVSSIQFNSLWPIISEITLTGGDLRSSLIQSAIGTVAIFAIAVIIQGIQNLPRLQRLKAFEDILTIAKAYRKGLGETAKPSVE